MLLALVSAKGSPGVTTTAAALAAAAAELQEASGDRQRVDMVELDPSGGDVEILTGVPGESGLLRAVADLSAVTVVEHVVDAPHGMRCLRAPTSWREASSAIAVGMGRWSPVLWEAGGVVVVDAGRWEPSQPLAGRIEGAHVAAVVCRSDVRSIEHARHIVPGLRELVGRVAVVVIGERPYGLNEIAACLGAEPAGTMLWDPRGVASFWEVGLRPRRFYTPLAGSARSVLLRLTGADKEVSTS